MYLWLAILMLAGCQVQGEGDGIGQAGVAFGVDLGGGKDSGLAPVLKGLEDARSMVVTIEDGSGTEVYSAEQIELYAFGSDYVSQPLVAGAEHVFTHADAHPG